MADYFVSDVHLRLDHPERSERFASFVEALSSSDALTIVGDLCDFWFTSRQRRSGPHHCPGLRALIDFRRRGGQLVILLGNHDAWLGSFYESSLGANVIPGAWEQSSFGVRVSAVHGHRLGARKPWKALMESRAFLHAFETLPDPIARSLADRLEHSNARSQAETHLRHLATYRTHSTSLISPGHAEVVLLGHVHDVYDEPIGHGRMIVLGDWIGGTSYVRIDDQGVEFVASRAPTKTQDIYQGQ